MSAADVATNPAGDAMVSDEKVDDSVEPMATDPAPEAPVEAPSKPAIKKGARKVSTGLVKAKKTKKSGGESELHPKYSEMIREAISHLKDRNGSSRQAILKYILAHYTVQTDERQVNNHLKMSLRAGVKSGKLKQLKGSGACGSYKLGTDSSQKAPKSKAKSPEKSTKMTKVKKPKTAATAKATKAKASPKKPKSPKKTTSVKSTTKAAKSPGKKSPAKKAAKSPPKSSKTPKKQTSPKEQTEVSKTPVETAQSAVQEPETVAQAPKKVAKKAGKGAKAKPSA